MPQNRKEDKERKFEIIGVRVHPEIKDEIDSIAKYYGFQTAPYVRSLIKTHLRENKDLIDELMKKEVEK